MQRLILPFVVLIGLLATHTSSAAPPFEQPRSYAFIEDRGGLLLKPSYRKNNRWWLAVDCNVSGIKTITVAPRTIHSGLAWSKSVAIIEEDKIYLTVYTAVQGPRAPSAICGDAPLDYLPRGHYPVYYRDPDSGSHSLGTIEIK